MHFPRLAAALHKALQRRIVDHRMPDFIVGDDSPGGAYLLLWYITPWRGWYRHIDEARRTRWQRFAVAISRCLPNLYLHQFQRDDDDRALHDHPSWAASLILAGSYIEHTIAAGGIHHRRVHTTGTLRFLPTRHVHRIELPRTNRQPQPCWTLFLFGPSLREWGFHCPERGWVHWRDFTAAGQPGRIGPGCDA